MRNFFKKRGRVLPAKHEDESLIAAFGSVRVLQFKSNRAAFEHACLWMHNAFEEGSTLPAIVERVWRRADGVQFMDVLVAREPDGASVTTVAALDDVPEIAIGDLVALEVGEEVSVGAISHVACFVIAKLQPVLDLQQGWKIADA